MPGDLSMDRTTTVKISPHILKIIKDYRQRIITAGIPVQKIIIFGSRAKGTARADSDIDLAIVSPSFGKDYFDEGVMLMHLRDGVYEIEPHPMHPDDLNDKWSTFTHEVKKWGIPV